MPTVAVVINQKHDHIRSREKVSSIQIAMLKKASSGRSLMYIMKSIRPKMGLWRLSTEGYHLELFRTVYYSETTKYDQTPDLNSIGFEFLKKVSKVNLINSLEYIQCHSLSIPKSVKSPSKSTRYNCQKTKATFHIANFRKVLSSLE